MGTPGFDSCSCSRSSRILWVGFPFFPASLIAERIPSRSASGKSGLILLDCGLHGCLLALKLTDCRHEKPSQVVLRSPESALYEIIRPCAFQVGMSGMAEAGKGGKCR